MSDFNAIATVTATLALEVLQKAAAEAVSGADASFGRPDGVNGKAHVNLYLYQVTPNAAWRNQDLPTYNSSGQLAQRPRVALDLHYLLTFYGKEDEFEPQRLLGNVALAMHANPILTRDIIRDFIGTATVPGSRYSFLAHSNLADSIELVKFSPLPLSLEEMTKLWSVLLQTKYDLSIAYLATVVLIEGEETPRTPLPVREREFFVVPFRHPTIERVRAQAGDNEPIVATSTLVIEGQQLRGEFTRLRLGSSDLMTLQDVTDTRIVFPLTALTPADVLRAGVQPLQVVQPIKMGHPPVEHVGVESNVMPVVVRPTIVSSHKLVTPFAVSLDVDLTVGRTQRVLLLLNQATDSNPLSYTFTAQPRTADLNTLEIPIGGAQAGEYWMRLQIDGAESVFTVDSKKDSPTFRHIIGPKVVVTPTITKIIAPDPTQIDIEVDVIVGRAQTAALVLTPAGGGNPLSPFDALPRSTDTQALTVPIQNVAAGDYLARVTIDGIESIASASVTIP